MRRGECAVCGDPTDRGFECSYCGVTHCATHRLPESHDCPGDLQSPATATRDEESDSTTRPRSAFDREDPAARMERVTTASPSSTVGDDGADEDVPDPREPTFEAASPDVNPDGSLAVDDRTESEHSGGSSGRLSAIDRIRYKLRATIRAPFGLLRRYAMPLLALLTLLAVAAGLLMVL